MKGRQHFAIEDDCRAREIGVLRTGSLPAVPDLIARGLQHGFVGRVFPRYQLHDDTEQSHALLPTGRRAHHKCSVLGCPWRIDFSRAHAALMASSGSATSMSFLLYVTRPPTATAPLMPT